MTERSPEQVFLDMGNGFDPDLQALAPLLLQLDTVHSCRPDDGRCDSCAVDYPCQIRRCLDRIAQAFSFIPGGVFSND